jgi:hypothetical protein
MTKYYSYEGEIPIPPDSPLVYDSLPQFGVFAATGEEADLAALTGCAEIGRAEFIAALAESPEAVALRGFLRDKAMVRSGGAHRGFDDGCIMRIDLRDAACGADRELWREYSRQRIAAAVGDPLELIADLSKRIGLLERMCMWIFADLLQNDVISAENKAAYIPQVLGYLQVVGSGAIKDRVDLEDKVAMMQRLMPRFGAIGDIVDEDYLQPLAALALGDGGDE